MNQHAIAPSNVELARGWDGPAGDLWTAHADHFDGQVADFLPPLLAAADVPPTGRVLDVGCGAGATTRECAALATDGAATGIDLSAKLLDLARRRAGRAGLSNVTFEQADAQVADLGTARYDRIVSRNGVMFFGDPVAAFSNLARTLEPGGRLALAVWQPMAENEWFTAFRTAAAAGRDLPLPPVDGPGPFSFGDPDRVRALLTAAGFAEPEFTDARGSMRYGDPAAAEPVVLGIVGGALDQLDESTRADAVQALRASLHEHDGPEGVTYRAAMWIITAGLR